MDDEGDEEDCILVLSLTGGATDADGHGPTDGDGLGNGERGLSRSISLAAGSSSLLSMPIPPLVTRGMPSSPYLHW